MSSEASFERVEKLLAAILLQTMKGATVREKVVQLSLAGFTTVEIADLLEIPNELAARYMWIERRKKDRATK